MANFEHKAFQEVANKHKAKVLFVEKDLAEDFIYFIKNNPFENKFNFFLCL